MQLKYKTGRTKITQTHFSFVFSRQWMVFFCCSVRCNVSCACRPLWLRYKNAYKLIKLHFLFLILSDPVAALRCMCCVFFVCVLLQTNDLTKTHAYFYDSLLLCITKVSLWYARSRFESHFGFSVEAEKNILTEKSVALCYLGHCSGPSRYRLR